MKFSTKVEKANTSHAASKSMIFGCFKIGKVLYFIISNTPLVIYETHVPAISMAYLGNIGQNNKRA